jgi:uncharacterized protein (TIGR02266 family)
MPSASRDPRAELTVPVEVEGDHGCHLGLIQNIGVGGVFVATEHLGHVGDRVALRFALPGHSRPVVVEAELRWNRKPGVAGHRSAGPGIGLKFRKLGLHAAASIDAFLRERAAARTDA